MKRRRKGSGVEEDETVKTANGSNGTSSPEPTTQTEGKLHKRKEEGEGSTHMTNGKMDSVGKRLKRKKGDEETPDEIVLKTKASKNDKLKEKKDLNSSHLNNNHISNRKEPEIKDKDDELPDPSLLKKLEQPKVDPSKVKYVIPEQHKPSSSQQSAYGASKKGKCLGVLPQDVPMEERLKEMASSTTHTKSKGGRKNKEGEGRDSESMVVLLTQALHSQDNDKLTIVSDVKKQSVISATVSQLPVQLILPFLKDLHSRMRRKADCRTLLRWMQAILSTHLSYLSSTLEIRAELGEIREWMERRVGCMERLVRLQGKLHILKEQAEKRTQPLASTQQDPKLIFEEESSSDDSDGEGEGEASGATSAEDTDLELDWWDETGVEKGSGSSSEEDEDMEGEDGSEPSGSDDNDSVIQKYRKTKSKKSNHSDEDDEDDAEDDDLEENFKVGGDREEGEEDEGDDVSD